MTDQPEWGHPDQEPTPPHPGWSPQQPGAVPPPPPAGYVNYPPPGYSQPPPPHQPPPPPPYPPQYGGYAYAPPAAPKPGVIPLRPLAVGEILDGAIQCVRANPKIMLGLSAVVVTISQLISFGLTAAFAQNLNSLDVETASPEDVLGSLGGLVGASLIGTLITALAQVILAGVLTVVVSRAVLGNTTTLSEAWTQLRPRLLSLVAVSLLVFVLSFLGLFLCLLPGVFLYVMWWLAGPALILERGGVTTSMRRSWTLVRGSWWRTFLIVVLTVVLTAVIAGIVAVPFGFIGGFGQFTGSGTEIGTISTLSLFGSTLGAIVGGTLTAPFTAAVTVLLYIDRRMRLEGLDLELARAAAAQPVPDSPTA